VVSKAVLLSRYVFLRRRLAVVGRFRVDVEPFSASEGEEGVFASVVSILLFRFRRMRPELLAVTRF
jgi:hypothetical protein